jgi:hypothetical protein
MGSVGDVADAVRAVVTQLAQARALLLGVAEPITAAGSVYTTVGQGSSTADLETSAAHLRQAYVVCGQVLQAVNDAIAKLNTYLSTIEGQAGDLPTSGVPVAVEPWRLSPDRVNSLRRELPREITPAERGTGRKTHGRWVGADNTARPVVSGLDTVSSGTENWLRARDLQPVSATHAEMKIAFILRRAAEKIGKPQHASIVVNNLPCPGRFGCSTLLPVMLPEGSTLTVHAPRYRRTFTGGQQP